MAKKNGLKDCDGRIRLPWKEDPKKAKRLYMQITRSKEPEITIQKLKKDMKL
jgi:hypothetical protein